MPFKYVDGTFNNMNNLPLGVVTVDFANMANVPSGGWGYGVVITAKIADNSNFKTQTAYCTKGSSGGEKNIFMRQQWGGTWGDWERLVRETELNAYSKVVFWNEGTGNNPVEYTFSDTNDNVYLVTAMSRGTDKGGAWLVLARSSVMYSVILNETDTTMTITGKKISIQATGTNINVAILKLGLNG